MTGRPAPAGDAPRPGAAVRIGISACLLGEPVRFDGGHRHERFLTTTVAPHVEWVPVCPEVAAGLGVPREAVRLVGTAERLAADLGRSALDGFVLKKSSPTCGLFRVPVHPPGGGRPAPGRGLFAAALTRRLPLLPVEEEGRLHNAGLREAFFDAVFAHHRWRRFTGDGPTRAGLVALHARHKMTLLAHDPAGARALGRVVARAGAGDGVVAAYAGGFMAALAVHATRGRHVDVLHHLFGLVSRRLDRRPRREFLGVVEDYRRGLVPLVVPVTLLRHHLLAGDGPEWARTQTYLSPYPPELMLRNQI